MTNVNSTPEKVEIRRLLFGAGVKTLLAQGWKVERVDGSGKSSVRRITKNSTSLTVAIRTTQDRYIAFPRELNDKKWKTLSEVDAVVAVSVDDKENPRFALVHMLDGQDMRARFDRTYAARKAAGHVIPKGRGVWLALYIPESTTQPALVGAGAGLESPPIARVPLRGTVVGESNADRPVEATEEGPIGFDEAKRRLGWFLGVDPSKIKILVEA